MNEAENAKMLSEAAESLETVLQSGLWTGYWLQGTQFNFQLHLTFDAGIMRGTGSDDIGHFSIHGHYDEVNGVFFTKIYGIGVSITYSGSYLSESRCLSGKWRSANGAQGHFWMWPFESQFVPPKGLHQQDHT